jgi:glutamate/aspartate transport system substrate-binding protein
VKRLLLAALLVVAATPWGAPAWADDSLLSGSLKTIHDRGTILIGVREASIPFSFLNKARQPIGFSVDICRGIATDVAAALNVDLLEPDAPAWQKGVRIIYVPVASDERLPKVISGAVDLECGSTTATETRAKTVAFSPVFFLAGTKLLVRKDSGIESYRDLTGKTVVASAGTTNGDAMKRLSARGTPAFTVVEAPDLPAAYDVLATGKAVAFASDDILLSAMVATKPDGKQFAVVGDYLSYEPYAIMLRRDDPEFADLVKRSFERMASDGTLHALYNRWLTRQLPTGENLDLPISSHLAEMYRVLGEPD